MSVETSAVIFACVIGWVLGAVPLLVFWSQLELAQCLTGLLLWLVLPLVLFVIQPFQHPLTKEIYWRTPWNIPTYVDPLMDQIMTPDLIQKIETVMPVDPGIRERSVNVKMPKSFSMSKIKGTLVVTIALALWFVLPQVLVRFLALRGEQK